MPHLRGWGINISLFETQAKHLQFAGHFYQADKEIFSPLILWCPVGRVQSQKLTCLPWPKWLPGIQDLIPGTWAQLWWIVVFGKKSECPVHSGGWRMMMMMMMMTILCNLFINTFILSHIFPCNEQPNSPDRVLSRIYSFGERSQVAEGDKLPRGSGGKWICTEMQSGAFWDTIVRNVTVCALTSSRLDDFSDIVTYIL